MLTAYCLTSLVGCPMVVILDHSEHAAQDKLWRTNLFLMGASLSAIEDISSTKQVGFIPQETLDEPFDVTLVVEDGNEFKAHRRVLSKASPFFEKLLNSDMRESNEGIVRLGMLSELGLRDILEFIYTGNIFQISAEDNAQDLIAMADYFDLPLLKILAGRVLVQELTDSNCISTYYLAKSFQCEELVHNTKDFIHSNFTVAAKTEEFLDLSSQEVKMWISSDEINVSAEEDVFNIIFTWIGHEKGERKKHFADLFRAVRLVHVSRDFLCSDILRNDLVNGNEDCMDLVEDALKLIGSESYDHLSVTPRRSLETPALVVHLVIHNHTPSRFPEPLISYRPAPFPEFEDPGDEDNNNKDHILCYYPREQKWSRFQGTQGTVLPPCDNGEVISCHGKLFFISGKGYGFRYQLSSKSWVPEPQSVPHGYDERYVVWPRFFVAKNVMYGLFPEIDDSPYNTNHSNILLMKYKRDSDSWEQTTSLDHDLGCRREICIVAKDSFVYFLGGCYANLMALTDADRYDLNTNTWDKLADLKKPKREAYGAAAYGKIFIAGVDGARNQLLTCEVYDELTNEWQLTAPIGGDPLHPALMCVLQQVVCCKRYLGLL